MASKKRVRIFAGPDGSGKKEYLNSNQDQTLLIEIPIY
jgi:predicted ABC-type ATPase